MNLHFLYKSEKLKKKFALAAIKMKLLTEGRAVVRDDDLYFLSTATKGSV